MFKSTWLDLRKNMQVPQRRKPNYIEDVRYSFVMSLIPWIFLRALYQPKHTVNKIHWNTNHIIKFMTSIKPLHISAPRYNPQAVSQNKEISRSNKPVHWYVGLVFLYFSRLPEDGTPVPKHVGVWYLSWIVLRDLYFIVFCWADLLVDAVATVHVSFL
jgi:hypothetical protein